MADGGNGLVLKFGTDFGDTYSKLSELAANATKNMAAVSAAAVATSKTLREQMTSGAAGASRSLISYAATWENLKTVSTVAGEAMKVGFALHHPVLAVGMQLLGNYKYALGAVAAGAITAVEAVKWLGEQVSAANAAIAGAEKAGVSTTLFQVWRDQADQARLSATEMTQALEHASTVLKPTFTTGGEQNINNVFRYSDQLQNGRGYATESYQAFKDAGTDVDKLQVAATLLVQDFQKAAVELGDVSLKAQAGQIATEVWGVNGGKIAEALASGKLNITEMAAKARDLGTVFSEDILRAQRESNAALTEASSKLSREMHPAMNTLLQMGVFYQNIWAKIVGYVATAAHWINQIAGAQASLGKHFADQAPNPAAIVGLRAHRGSVDPTQRDQLSTAPLPPRRPSLSVLEASSPHTPAAHSAKDATEATKALDTYVTSLEKANAVSLAELDTIGKSNTAKATAVDLARAEEAARKDLADGKRTSATLTDEERTKIVALAEAEGRLKDATEQANKAQEAMNSAQHAFTDTAESTIEKLIDGHTKFRDILKDIVKQFESMAIKSLISGSGPLAGVTGTAPAQSGGTGGIFGALFGGAKSVASGASDSNFLADLVGFNPFAFADGGVMTSRGPVPLRRYAAGGIANSPQMAMFGEGSGPEAYVPLADGRTIPVSLRLPDVSAMMPTAPRATGGGGTSTINQHFHLNGTITEGDAHRMIRQTAASAISDYHRAVVMAPKRSF